MKITGRQGGEAEGTHGSGVEESGGGGGQQGEQRGRRGRRFGWVQVYNGCEVCARKGAVRILVRCSRVIPKMLEAMSMT